MAGRRDSTGKPMHHLQPADALIAVSEVLTFGCTGVNNLGEKRKEDPYPTRNWEEGMKYSELIRPILSHCFKIMNGQDYEEESGMLNSAHLATNALMLVAHQLRGIGDDDRPNSIKTPSGTCGEHRETVLSVLDRVLDTNDSDCPQELLSGDDPLQAVVATNELDNAPYLGIVHYYPTGDNFSPDYPDGAPAWYFKEYHRGTVTTHGPWSSRTAAENARWKLMKY